MKYLRVTMPDKSRWDVPAGLIAHDRANYYAKNKTPEQFHREFELAMGDANTLVDWAENDMNWIHVKACAKLVVPSSDADYQDGWVNGPKEIVDHD